MCEKSLEYKPLADTDWPQCIDRLDCSPPQYDQYVLSSTWQTGDTLTPEFTIE